MKVIGFIQGVIDGICCGLSLWAVDYTDAASVNLILMTTLPFTMLFNFLLLKERYSYGKIIVALAICLMAVMYTVLDKDNFYPGNNKTLGDIMTLVSCIGYGFEATYTEKFVSNS